MTSTNLEWLSESARKNPEGVLLLAAGLALLLRKTSSAARSANQNSRSVGDNFVDYDQHYGKQPGSLSRAAQGAKEYASDVRDSVAETASGYASTVSDFVGDTSRKVVDRSGEFASKAQSTFQQSVDRVLQDQPLAIALAGLAAGAAVAAAFPVSKIERDTLSPVGERLGEVASEGKRRLGSAATAAAHELQNVAAEKGLSAEGLKEVARDLSETVGDAFTGSAASSGQRDALPKSTGTPNNRGAGSAPKS